MKPHSPLLIACFLICNSISTTLLSGATVTVDLDDTRQTIEGFGTSISYGGSFGVYDDEEFLDYISYELGFSMFRMEIQGIVSQPVMDAADLEWEDFDLDPATGNGRGVDLSILFARGIQSRSPDARVIGTVWTPPAWMKDNNSTTGSRSGFLLSGVDPDNHLSDDKYAHFAKFLMEYVELFRSRGVPVFALSPANELMFTQVFQSCLWYPDEYARIIRTLGETFSVHGVEKPLFYGPEDMTFADYSTTRHKPYVDALMEPGVAEYFDVFATHGYTDGVQSSGPTGPALYWENIRQFNRQYWITEGGTGGHDWPVPIETGIGAHLHYALAEGNVSAFTAWQINGSGPDEHSIMVNGAPTKKTYAAMHYWRYIRPGFVRVGTSVSGRDAAGVRLSAYRDVERERLVIVAINNNSVARQLDLGILGDTGVVGLQVYQTSETSDFENVGYVDLSSVSPGVSLPADSITTLASSIPVAGIAFEQEVLELDIGGLGQLVSHVEPASATNWRVNYSSSNENVATVNGSGEVTAIAEGDATITAVTADGGYSATAEVRVRFLDWAGWPVQNGQHVDTGDAFIGPLAAWKDTGWIYSYNNRGWMYLPEEDVRPESAWVYLHDEGAAATAQPVVTETGRSVSAAGFVQVAEETTNVLLNKSVTVSSFAPGSPGEYLVDDSYGFTESNRWITTDYPQWAVIDLGAPHHLSEFRLYPWQDRGYQYTIEVSEDGIDYSLVVDRSDNDTSSSVLVDSVDASGRYVRLSILAGGTYTGGWVNLHELQGMGSVILFPVSGVQVTPSKLQRGVGQTYQLTTSFTPQYATNREVTWSSSNTSVATVDQTGRISAVGEGVADITVTTMDGGYTATSRVTVGDSPVWARWEISEDGLADTGALAGHIKVLDDSGWVYLFDLGRWAWLPETSVRDAGAWAQLVY